MSQRALALLYERTDKGFFKQHFERKAHIRKPYQGECEGEFWTLGEHERDRRRILLCRVDGRGAFLPDGKIFKIPFLAFSDETIEDSDAILLPIIDEIMRNAAENPR